MRRRKWIVLQAVVLVPLAAVLLSFRGEPLYSASAEVLLNQQNLALTLTDKSDSAAAQPERNAETQARLAQVPEVARRVLKSLRLEDRSPEDFLAYAGVAAQPNADILAFSVIDGNPALAVDMVNAYAREYTNYRRQLDTAAVARARGELEQEIDRLEDQGERGSALYADLVGKYQQLRTIEALQTSNASVVREARLAKQIEPRPKRNAVLGLALGLVLGLALAFIWEALDTRVRSTQHIERVLGLPLLARLPRPPRPLERAQKLVMMRSPRSSEAEAYRILRTNLEFFNVEQGARTLMITSAVSGEGKSTTIANLAVALARAGQRVVLLDLDLRRPILARFFDSPDDEREPMTLARGLAEIRRVRFGHIGVMGDDQGGSLDVVSSRPLPNAGDFVGSDELGQIVDELRSRADILLIDAPPLLVVGDAMQLSAKVDALLVVTRLNVVRQQMLVELRRVLDACPALKLGFVVTGAEVEPDYRYYYYAAYPYYTRAASSDRSGE